jgi:hypothetical protein
MKHDKEVVMSIYSIACVLGLVFSGFCGFLAKEKDRNAANWMLLGFFFGPIALLTLVGAPSLGEKEKE